MAENIAQTTQPSRVTKAERVADEALEKLFAQGIVPKAAVVGKYADEGTSYRQGGQTQMYRSFRYVLADAERSFLSIMVTRRAGKDPWRPVRATKFQDCRPTWQRVWRAEAGVGFWEDRP